MRDIASTSVSVIDPGFADAQGAVAAGSQSTRQGICICFDGCELGLS